MIDAKIFGYILKLSQIKILKKIINVFLIDNNKSKFRI